MSLILGKLLSYKDSNKVHFRPFLPRYSPSPHPPKGAWSKKSSEESMKISLRALSLGNFVINKFIYET